MEAGLTCKLHLFQGAIIEGLVSELSRGASLGTLSLEQNLVRQERLIGRGVFQPPSRWLCLAAEPP